MTHQPASRQAAEARALIAALAIASEARWSLERAGPVLDPPFSNYLYVERAELLLVPTSDTLEHQMAVTGRAMREARSDALLIRAPTPNARRVELAVGIWALTKIHWLAPMTLWRPQGQPLWLMPDPYLAAVRHVCFRLEDGRLLAAAAPWADLHEQRVGQAQGEVWISRVLSQRGGMGN